MPGVAVKVTGFPWQNGFVEGEMEIVTGRFGLTVMVRVLLVAGLPVGQTALEVSTQLTTSPLMGV